MTFFPSIKNLISVGRGIKASFRRKSSRKKVMSRFPCLILTFGSFFSSSSMILFARKIPRGCIPIMTELVKRSWFSINWWQRRWMVIWNFWPSSKVRFWISALIWVKVVNKAESWKLDRKWSQKKYERLFMVKAPGFTWESSEMGQDKFFFLRRCIGDSSELLRSR